MTERHINDPQPTPEAPASVDASARALASARRRHFIKLGSGIVPVAMTLASRPVMATNCMTASAWGSTMGATVTGTSAFARAQAKTTYITGAFALDKWIKVNTSTNYPSYAGWGNIANCGDFDKVKAYTVSTLTGGVGIAGMSSDASVWNCLMSTGTSDAAKYRRAMCVAWLNFRVSSKVSACVKDPMRSSYNALAVFSAIGTGGGTGPDGRQWSQANVTYYLSENWISRPTT